MRRTGIKYAFVELLLGSVTCGIYCITIEIINYASIVLLLN